MSLKCERKTLHKYYSYRDKINVKKTIQYYNNNNNNIIVY